jgi:hypothetical protein
MVEPKEEGRLCARETIQKAGKDVSISSEVDWTIKQALFQH